MDWAALKNQQQWKDGLQKLLRTNDLALEKAIVVIYSFQTDDEKRSDQTFEHNGLGFSAFDANILSSFAKQIDEKKSLTEKQKVIARLKVPRYWKQLMLISKRNIESRPVVPVQLRLF